MRKLWGNIIWFNIYNKKGFKFHLRCLKLNWTCVFTYVTRLQKDAWIIFVFLICVPIYPRVCNNLTRTWGTLLRLTSLHKLLNNFLKITISLILPTYFAYNIKSIDFRINRYFFYYYYFSYKSWSYKSNMQNVSWLDPVSPDITVTNCSSCIMYMWMLRLFTYFSCLLAVSRIIHKLKDRLWWNFLQLLPGPRKKLKYFSPWRNFYRKWICQLYEIRFLLIFYGKLI